MLSTHVRVFVVYKIVHMLASGSYLTDTIMCLKSYVMN